MSESLAFHQTENGWALPMLPEMASAAGVAEGSILIVHLHPGSVEAEILPPPSEESKRAVRRSVEKFGDFYAELKRLGD